ncbi:MAG TPA: hypothetical protein VK856_02280 [Anaerolineaceae bacterium]|nr:hypothetical protein [Anaerolineaceae bacterium]
MQIVFGIFLILHGLVHMWYVVLSQGWVEFQSEMGWTGISWLLTGTIGNKLTHILASISYSVAAVVFVISAVGLFTKQEWTRTSTIAASLISIFAILLFWDGKLNQLVERGLLGLLISIGILVAAVIFRWPTF